MYLVEEKWLGISFFSCQIRVLNPNGADAPTAPAHFIYHFTPLNYIVTMSQLEEENYQILFQNGFSTVTWTPDGPATPVSIPTGALNFPVPVTTLVNFTFTDGDNNTLPVLNVVFNGTEGAAIFTLSSPSSWTTRQTDVFEYDGALLGFTVNDGGIQIVGTVDIGDASDVE